MTGTLIAVATTGAKADKARDPAPPVTPVGTAGGPLVLAHGLRLQARAVK